MEGRRDAINKHGEENKLGNEIKKKIARICGKYERIRRIATMTKQKIRILKG